MATLRREVRKTIEKIFDEWALGAYVDDVPALVTEITDKIFDLPFFKKREDSAFDRKRADPAFEILFGNRTQEEVDETKLHEDALNEFTRALKLPAINFYPNRNSDEVAMRVLRELIFNVYKQDRSAFTRYETWRQQPFSRGAISNSTIKSYPEKFIFSWSDFERSEGKIGNRSDNNSQIEVGDDGIPRTY